MSVTRPWPHTLVESQYMELRTYSDENLNDQVGWAFWSCDDENGKEIHPHPIVNCPVTFANNSPYLAFMVVWAGYFLVLFLYHFYQCMQYPVTDLRYYINLINAENNKYHKRYIIAGMVLTVFSFIYACQRSMTNPATSKVEVLFAQIQFLIVNIFVLKQFIIEGTHDVSPVCMEADFPNPIPLLDVPAERHKSLFNLWGRILSVDGLLEHLLRLVAVKRLNCKHGAATGNIQAPGPSESDSSVSSTASEGGGVERALWLLFGGGGSRAGVARVLEDDADIKTQLLSPASNGSL